MTPEQRAEWLAERRLGLGSSDAPAILGISPWKTPLDVYLSKVDDAHPSEPNFAQQVGITLESAVAELFALATGRDVAPPTARIIRHPNHPWLLCSPDRFTRGDDGAWQLLEIKTARSWDGWGETGTEEIPPHYYAQVQHQLLAASHWGGCPGFHSESAIVAVLIGGCDLRWYPIAKADDFCEMMFLRLAYFWQHHVEQLVPPEPQPGEDDGLKKLLNVWKGRVRPGASINLTQEDLDDVIAYEDYGKGIRELQENREIIRNRLADSILSTGCEFGILPDSRRIRVRNVHVKGHTVEPTTRADFRILNAKEVASAELSPHE